MRPELGPPDLEERTYPEEDPSWTPEWEHLARAIESAEPVLDSLADAHYAWAVEAAYAGAPVYAGLAAALQA